MSRMYTFQFGRVSSVGRPLDNKTDFYSTVFSSKKTVSDERNKFMFHDVQLFSENHEDFFIGKLVKYKAKEEDIVIEDYNDISTSIIDNAVIAKPEFVLHSYSGIIAFRLMKSLFGPNQFRNKFARLVEATFDNFFISTKVETVNEQFEISEQFHRIDRIKSIILNLHPSNPNNNDYWRNVDEKIKDYGASEFNQEIKAPENGSLNKNRLENSDIYAGLLMASDGYGFASIDGVLPDGQRVKVTTEDNPIEAKTTLDGVPEHLISQLLRTFQSVWKRTNNADKH